MGLSAQNSNDGLWGQTEGFSIPTVGLWSGVTGLSQPAATIIEGQNITTDAGVNITTDAGVQIITG